MVTYLRLSVLTEVCVVYVTTAIIKAKLPLIHSLQMQMQYSIKIQSSV